MSVIYLLIMMNFENTINLFGTENYYIKLIMNKILLSFILTSIAGLSTILGYFIIYIKGNKNKIITLTLAFASGVMLTISVTDLIPSSFTYFIVFNI